MKNTYKIYPIILVLLFFTQHSLYGQTNEDKKFIRSKTNVEALKKISEKSNNNYLQNLKQSEENGIPKVVYKNNKQYNLSGFDLNGKAVYDFDDNINSAKSAGIDKFRQGGISGLDLDGSQIIIGYWEATGLPLLTHQEINGKITQVESGSVNSHTTHVACTMIGAGINNDAKGMAPSASIVSRKSDNDESEIADFAIDGGILSNHSYGTGNPDGYTPHYGVYFNNSKEWDEILFYAPYLTLCKSAGNSRNDSVNIDDGGYDILYTVTLSKNLITVGAVNVMNYNGPQSITQSSFSSCGPSDDWRIKPDLVTKGVNVFSANKNNDTDYVHMSGTSTATPCLTGAVALLQQHYHDNNDMYMKSATVKALHIATTNESGPNDGPDFRNRWGLLDANRAAMVISNNKTYSLIDEFSLSEGESYTTTVKANGTEPLSLAIAWTDPAGQPVDDSIDDQTPMLVNDLDVRIINETTTYYPWTMTPNANSNNFTDPATKGDNFRDNVERIDVKNISQGTYNIRVTHKGNLVNGNQDFSLVVNGITDKFNVYNTPSHKEEILIYPNPSSSGHFNISLPNEWTTKSYELKVYDMLGSVVKQSVYSEKEINLSLSDIDSGSYIFQIQINGKTHHQLVTIGR